MSRAQPWAGVVYGLALTALVLIAIAAPASAEIFPKQIVPEACRLGGSDCKLCHLGLVVINITKILMLAIAIPAVGLLVAISGFIFMTAGGSPTQIERGKKILTATIVGALIVFLAWLGVDTFFKVVVGQQGFRRDVAGKFGPWNEFPVENCPL